MTVAVIGSGLAGTCAALSAAEVGAEVVVIGGRPGASALWSGVGEVFGPIYDRIDHQDPLHRPHLVTVGQPPLEGRAARLQRLVRRRSFHPYTRLDLGPDDVATTAERAIEALAGAVGWLDGSSSSTPTYVGNSEGTVRLADAAAPSVAAGGLEGSARYCLIGFEHYPRFDATAAARALESQGLHATDRWLSVDGAGLAQSPAVAAARLEALDDGTLAALGRQIANAADGDVALLPPILGRSPDAHARVFGKLRAGAGSQAALGELAAIHKSLHGFRLHLKLIERLDEAGVRTVNDRVESVELTDSARRVRALVTERGERVEVDAIVLATGRAIGGGIERRPPLRESVFGLPLYIEGAPVEPGQFPPELATRRLFDDHPLFRLGVGISTRLEPLGPDARPAFGNVRAAGLLIGGTDFTRDGSAFGVGLVTGWLAGRWSAGAD